MTKHLLCVLIAIAPACSSTAGPFVTNLAPAGPGRLSMTKCFVEYDPNGFAHVSTTNCTIEMLYLPPAYLPPPPEQVRPAPQVPQVPLVPPVPPVPGG